MNAANDDFEGPLPVLNVRATGRRKTAEAVAQFKNMLSRAGEVAADMAVPIAFAIMLAAAGFHQP